MFHDWLADDKFFEQLDREDARIAARLKAGGCRFCGGRLDQADYPRKPRGGWVGAAGESLTRRRSCCCAREGCRRRATPASLVFLGRRVYLGIAVVVGALRALSPPGPMPPSRTVRRWLGWFRTELPSSAWLATVRGRLWPALEPSEVLPDAVVERFSQSRPLGPALVATLELLSPLSTATASSPSG